MNAPTGRHNTPHSINSDGGDKASLRHNSTLARLTSLARVYGSIEDAVVASALGISAIMGFAGIILRFVLHLTVWEVFPVQHYTFLFAVLLGAATASRRGIHVRVEVLDTLLKSRPRQLLTIRASMLAIAVVCCLIFTYHAFGFAQWAWSVKQTDTVLKWFNLGIVKSLPFVTGFVSTIAFSVFLVKALCTLRQERNYSEQEST